MTLSRLSLISPYALSVFGGVQEQVLAMSREWARRGVDVQIVAPDHDDLAIYDTPARVERFGARTTVPANGSRAPLTLSASAARAARAAVERFGPDVVHFHEPFAPLVGWSTLRAHDAPAVATFHRSGEGPAVSLAAPLLRRLSRHLDAAAAVSAAAAHTAQRSCGVTCVELFNGFEIARFSEFARVVEPVTTVVVVGRLEERKGVAVAIDALIAHSAHGTPWRLVVVGDGPLATPLRMRAQGHDVLFTGRVSDEEKRRWYRRADVVVAPATFGESFGLVLLEAMASSARVVASDIPGYRDAAASHAVLFRAGDPLDLDRAIETALATRDDATLAAAKAHAERWSMTSLVDRYGEIYDHAQRRFSGLG